MREGKACKCARRLHWLRDHPVAKQWRRRNRTWAKHTRHRSQVPFPPHHNPSFCPLSDGAIHAHTGFYSWDSGTGTGVDTRAGGRKDVQRKDRRAMARYAWKSSTRAFLSVAGYWGSFLFSSLLAYYLHMTCYEATHTTHTHTHTYT